MKTLLIVLSLSSSALAAVPEDAPLYEPTASEFDGLEAARFKLQHDYLNTQLKLKEDTLGGPIVMMVTGFVTLIPSGIGVNNINPSNPAHKLAMGGAIIGGTLFISGTIWLIHRIFERADLTDQLKTLEFKYFDFGFGNIKRDTCRLYF